MYSNGKHSLINVPRHSRLLCKYERQNSGCRNVNCLYRHQNRVPYTIPALQDLDCDGEEAEKLLSIYKQPEIFYPNECPVPYVPHDSVYKKTNIPTKEEMQMKLIEKKRKLEELASTFAADMAKKAKKDQDSALLKLQSLENMEPMEH